MAPAASCLPSRFTIPRLNSVCGWVGLIASDLSNCAIASSGLPEYQSAVPRSVLRFTFARVAGERLLVRRDRLGVAAGVVVACCRAGCSPARSPGRGRGCCAAPGPAARRATPGLRRARRPARGACATGVTTGAGGRCAEDDVADGEAEDEARSGDERPGGGRGLLLGHIVVENYELRTTNDELNGELRTGNRVTLSRIPKVQEKRAAPSIEAARLPHSRLRTSSSFAVRSSLTYALTFQLRSTFM